MQNPRELSDEISRVCCKDRPATSVQLNGCWIKLVVPLDAAHCLRMHICLAWVWRHCFFGRCRKRSCCVSRTEVHDMRKGMHGWVGAVCGTGFGRECEHAQQKHELERLRA